MCSKSMETPEIINPVNLFIATPRSASNLDQANIIKMIGFGTLWKMSTRALYVIQSTKLCNRSLPMESTSHPVCSTTFSSSLSSSFSHLKSYLIYWGWLMRGALLKGSGREKRSIKGQIQYRTFHTSIKEQIMKYETGNSCTNKKQMASTSKKNKTHQLQITPLISYLSDLPARQIN